MSSKLLVHEDHQIFIKSGPTVALCLFGHNKKYFVQNLFQQPDQLFKDFKWNVQIRNYFENIIFIVCK